ncbi:putative Cellulose biosynthesis protein BcsE [Burkholderiales bacterium]|nr:putative Cellulose biosynthesis protein BcsE [Burkholderiales bacterium]
MNARALAGEPVAGPTLASMSALLSRWLERTALRETRVGSLPIAGLPEGIGELPPRELSLLLCADHASRERLLRSLLTTDVPRRRVSWICAAGQARYEAGPELRSATQRKQLLALTWTGDAASQLRQLGPQHLLRELATSGMGPHDLLVLDGLDPWLAETPEDAALEASIAEAAQALLRLAKAHRGPVLALAPAQVRGQPLLPLLAHSNLSRLGALQLDGASSHLQVVRWSPAQRARPRQLAARCLLELGADGRWHCRGSTDLDPAPLLTAADAQTTHAMRGALHDASATPAHWRVHANLEALIAAARDAVSATIVLAHHNPDDVVFLADAVYRLRREHPRLLKIIVRETESTLRRNGELALLRLGANAVVGRELGFSHLVQLVGELGDQPYAKVPALEPARALQALAPDPIQGYLPLPAFCSTVERMLERTAETALEHSLVQVPLMPHVAHLDALLACQCRRDGDVVTADAHGLVIFLFGCPHDDAMAALESIFAIPCSELARLVQIEPDGNSQRQALARLRRAADQSPLDFSAVLRGISPGRRPAPVQAAVLPTRSVEAARCVHAHVLPLRTAAA